MAGKLSRNLSPDLAQVLYESRRISELYSHQATAINRLWEGKHVIVSTSTASGKSLIYQIPVLDALQEDQSVKALYIFPTKALAQDQKKSLQDIVAAISSLSHIVVDTFDGDTPQSDRNRIRETTSGMQSHSRCRRKANVKVILTNPDTLHITILPNEEKWRSFLKNLKYVVVDGRMVIFFSLTSRITRVHWPLRIACFIRYAASAPFVRRSWKSQASTVHLVHSDSSKCDRGLNLRVATAHDIAHEGRVWIG
jgi:DEAD/DEAH box helicase domain-containing protein